MQQITLNTGKVIVTDPCYEPANGYNRLLKNVLPGNWNCTARKKNCGPWGSRITSLTIRHEDYPKGRIEEYEGCVAVDSGQCGFFEPGYYEENYKDDAYDNLESWYRRVCGRTSSEPCWGVFEGMGVVSESGYGDGCYDIYSLRNDSGYIVGLRLKFI